MTKSTGTTPDAGTFESTGPKRVLLAKPRGYCAGVDRAVEVVERALDLYGAPVYVRKQIVHNRHVVETLEKRGAIFVEENDEVPEGYEVVSAWTFVGQGYLDLEQAAAAVASAALARTRGTARRSTQSSVDDDTKGR